MAMSRNTVCAALLGLLLAGADANGAEIDQAKAAAVMAAFVRHIAALTDWPGQDDSETDDPIRIGLVGRDPNGVMSPIRSRTQSGEGLLAQGRSIELLDLDSAPEDVQILTCAMLFFSADAEREWDRLRPVLADRPIVTISEMEGFADRGGIVEFRIDRRLGKVRIRVNLHAMRTAGVTLSARFLGLDSVMLVDAPKEAR
jgi:hypothetical protein